VIILPILDVGDIAAILKVVGSDRACNKSRRAIAAEEGSGF
jgi:hypothetical protein